MTRRRAFALVLMLYLALDYCDASAPGVFFFFDAEVFYLEGVVESRADTPPATPAPAPTPAGGDRPVELDRPAVRVVAAARPTSVAFGSRAALIGAPPPSDARSEDH